MITKFLSISLTPPSPGPKLSNIFNNSARLLILWSPILLRRKPQILNTVTLKWKMRKPLIELFWLEFTRFKENKSSPFELLVLKRIRKAIKNFSSKSRVSLIHWRILNKMPYNSSWNTEKSEKDPKLKAQATKNTKWSSPTQARKLPLMQFKHSKHLPSTKAIYRKILIWSCTTSTQNKTKSTYPDLRRILKPQSNKRLKYSAKFQRLPWAGPNLITF